MVAPRARPPAISARRVALRARHLRPARRRVEIDAHLQLGDLGQIDIGEEIALQLRTVKIMQSEALEDSEAAYGQKAQASMVVVRLLQDLTKMRTDLHSAERFMMLENAVIECMRDQPQEVKDAFFAQYEAIAAKFDIGLKLVPEEPVDNS